MTTPSPELFLEMQRTFKAPRERVFRAWTEARALEQWFKPMGRASTVTQLDLKVGGSFHIELLHEDGATSAISGTYLEITPPEKLSFTWSSHATEYRDTLVTLHLVERDGVTELTLKHERLRGDEMRSAHRVGWEAVIDLLAEVV